MSRQMVINKMVPIFAQRDEDWKRTLVGVLTDSALGDGWQPEITMIRNKYKDRQIINSETAAMLRKHIVDALRKSPDIAAGMLPADVPGWRFLWSLVSADVEDVPDLAIRREGCKK